MDLPVLSTESGERIGPDTPTDQLIAWALGRFANQRVIVTTSFGMEGCALVDMVARHKVPLTVAYLDTMFFFPETYQLRDAMIARFPHLKFENRGTTLTSEEQAARHGPELWKTDPNLCCRLRKVDPMFAVMKDVDIWITGLRRSQSVSRANLELIEWDWQYQVMKFNPLAFWERPAIWQYIQQHQVPFNPLHEQGYPTVGCTHCTKPVDGAAPDDYSRSGRWAEFNKTECGLHGDGI